MGCVSLTAVSVALVQNSSDASWQPMENSPPGIHTMPSGAGPGAAALFGTVGAKAAEAGAGEPLAARVSAADAARDSRTKARATHARRGFEVMFLSVLLVVLNLCGQAAFRSRLPGTEFVLLSFGFPLLAQISCAIAKS